MGSLPKATKRKDLIKRFRALGFTGPHHGVGRHPEYMERDGHIVKLPNKHARGDIGEGLLKTILQQAHLTADEWLGRKDTNAD